MSTFENQMTCINTENVNIRPNSPSQVNNNNNTMIRTSAKSHASSSPHQHEDSLHYDQHVKQSYSTSSDKINMNYNSSSPNDQSNSSHLQNTSMHAFPPLNNTFNHQGSYNDSTISARTIYRGNSPPSQRNNNGMATNGFHPTQENEATNNKYISTKTINTNHNHLMSSTTPPSNGGHHQSNLLGGGSVGTNPLEDSKFVTNGQVLNHHHHHHHHLTSNIYPSNNGSNNNTGGYDMNQRSTVQSTNPPSLHDKMLPSVHVLMDSPASTSPSNPIPHSNTRVYASPSQHMRSGGQSSSNNLQQSNYMNQPITPIPYSQPPPPTHHQQQHHNDYTNYKASHHIDMFSNPPTPSSIKSVNSTNSTDPNMYAPRPVRSRSTSGGNTNTSTNTSFNNHTQQPIVDNNTVFSFEHPGKIKKKKLPPASSTLNQDQDANEDKKNWKKKRLFSIDEVTDLVAFVKQRSENQELTRDVNYAIFKEYEKLQDERRRASVYRKKYVQLFERHLIAKDGTIDPSLFQEYDQRASSSKSKSSHSEDNIDKRKYSDVEYESSSTEGSNVEEEKRPKKVKMEKRDYSDEDEEDVDVQQASNEGGYEKKKSTCMNICVSYNGKNYLHSIEKSILQNSESIHNYFSNLSLSSLLCNTDSVENIRQGSIEYFDYSFNEFIQINTFSITRVLKNTPVKLRIN